MEASELINEREAAKTLAVATRTLQWWRIRGGGPKFVKLGRAVRYRRSDLLAWIDANTVTSTSAKPTLKSKAPVSKVPVRLPPPDYGRE